LRSKCLEGYKDIGHRVMREEEEYNKGGTFKFLLSLHTHIRVIKSRRMTSKIYGAQRTKEECMKKKC